MLPAGEQVAGLSVQVERAVVTRKAYERGIVAIGAASFDLQDLVSAFNLPADSTCDGAKVRDLIPSLHQRGRHARTMRRIAGLPIRLVDEPDWYYTSRADHANPRGKDVDCTWRHA
jgi:hypothetical protein